MRELPTGTVTFLFTDIEGSTRLLRELGGGYAEALSTHRRVLRNAFARHGGVEVDTQGDAFFVAFKRAADALAAAADAQQTLGGGPIRVRMGLHTGEPALTDEGYVGLDVHRAARIAAAAHGGQVLVSQTTRELAGDDGLHDLGEHRLKDLAAPERIFQFGEGEFPPLKTLYQTNLPVQPTPFVGRQRELTELLDLVNRHRLVTLTGPGGSGKTRLALQAAAELVDEFADGVWFVSLAALRNPEFVEATIAEALGVRDVLERYLRTKEMLLVLDNFEQLVEAAPLVAELAATASSIRFLVTSRERLALAGEHEFAVPPLVVDEAVSLFSLLAQALNPGFESNRDVTEICSRLDGLPLAVELAAARSKVLTPAQILGRLGNRLDLLTGGARDAPRRQRALRPTIEWSYELLDPPERVQLARLSVLAGSFSLEAAEGIARADIDTLASLVDKSLLRRTDEGRFFMLEMIQEFAAERLEELGETKSLRVRQAEWTLALAERAEPHLEGSDQTTWFDLLELERDNIRAAFTTLSKLGRYDDGLRLAAALWRLWFSRGPVVEGTRVVEAALVAAPTAAVADRLVALRALGYFAYAGGAWAEAARFLTQALDLSRRAVNIREQALALLGLGACAATQNDLATAKRHHEEAARLAADIADVRTAGIAAATLGTLALHERDYVRARALFEQSLAAFGDDEFATVVNLGNLSLTALRLGEIDEAAARIRENLRLAVRLQDNLATAHALEILAAVVNARAQSTLAAQVLGAAAGLREEESLSLQELEDELHEETYGSVRSLLGEEGFAEQLELGSSSELREVVERALSSLGSKSSATGDT
jgi:predicted ATPase